jgi:hypothetical protein
MGFYPSELFPRWEPLRLSTPVAVLTFTASLQSRTRRQPVPPTSMDAEERVRRLRRGGSLGRSPARLCSPSQSVAFRAGVSRPAGPMLSWGSLLSREQPPVPWLPLPGASSRGLARCRLAPARRPEPAGHERPSESQSVRRWASLSRDRSPLLRSSYLVTPLFGSRL